MQVRRRWQDWVNLVLGVWLFFSPFFGVTEVVNNVAAWNSYIFGAAVTIFAGVALSRPQMWEEGINLVLGAWLIIAPFILAFTFESGALWNHIILGIIIGGDALWAMLQKPAGGPAEHKPAQHQP